MRRVILAFSILALTLTSVQTAFAKTFDLLIHNDTENDVKIKLKGDENYSFTASPGKMGKTVKEGKYDVSYKACQGRVVVETSITVTEERVWLIIEKCPAVLEYAKFVVYSNIHEKLTLSMSGPKDYELTLGLGKNKFIDIAAGTYTYSHDYCDIPVGGTIRVRQNGTSSLKVLGCERVEILSLGLPNPRDLRLASHYAFPFTLTLIGPKQYYLTVNPGITRIDVIKGTYTYIYTAYHHIYSGEINVTVGGFFNTVIFSPLSPEP